MWDGNYYAYELERFLGLDPDGAVRAGFVHYNDAEDVSRLVETVTEIASGVPAQDAGTTEETPA